jgi:hypothetical protein
VGRRHLMKTSTQKAPEQPERADTQPEDTEPEEGEVDEKTERKKGGKAPKRGQAKKAAKGERKRGPARPYRKLPQETLESRIKKLQKRIERTSAQAEEGRSFLVKYTREQSFRESEAAVSG